MSHRSFLLAATGAAFLSCTSGGDGGDGAGGGLSSLFDSLNGEYQLEQGTDCAIEILGSRVRSLDSKGRTLCQRAGESWSESMQMSGTFSDTRLSGTLEYSDVDDEGFEDGRGGLCRRHSTEKVTITAELDKLRGRSREGRFAGLAGVWEGTLHIEERIERADGEDDGDDDGGQGHSHQPEPVSVDPGQDEEHGEDGYRPVAP